MKSKMRLSLLACALGAAAIATAQTSNDASPPNDVIRSPGSVATPIMPVEVSPSRDDSVGTAAANGNSRQAFPVVRSIGSNNNASDQTLSGDTMIDGAATGAVVTPNPDGKAGVVRSGTRASDSAGAETAPGSDASTAGANPGTGDATGEATPKMGNQDNKQPNELNQDASNQPGTPKMGPTTRPDVTRTDAGVSGASDGK